MNTGIFGEGFPYSNFHDLNMDWIIKIAKDFLDQYTHIQEIIEQGQTDIQDLTTSGLAQLQDKADTLEGLLQAWYNEHSEDIANELAEALGSLNSWYTEHSTDISNELASAITSLNNKLAENISAFNASANAKGEEVIATIPQTYTEIDSAVKELNLLKYYPYVFKGAIQPNGTYQDAPSMQFRATDFIPVKDSLIVFGRFGQIDSSFYHICCYDENKNFVENLERYTADTDIFETYTLNSNTRYIRCTTTDSFVNASFIFNYTGLLNEILTNLKMLFSCVFNTYGKITTAGDITTLANVGNGFGIAISNKIPKNSYIDKVIFSSDMSDSEDHYVVFVNDQNVVTNKYPISGKTVDIKLITPTSGYLMYGRTSGISIANVLKYKSNANISGFTPIAEYIIALNNTLPVGTTVSSRDFFNSTKDNLGCEIYGSLNSDTGYSNKFFSFFGDSIVRGYTQNGESFEVVDHPFPEQVSKFFECAYENKGYSGYPISSLGNANCLLTKTGTLSSKATHILIMAGTNDYALNTPLGTIADLTDVSFYGALHVLLSNVAVSYPNAQIVFMTPIHRETETANSTGKTFLDYIKAIRESCELHSIPLIDLYNESGISWRIGAYRTYLSDGLHPTQEGYDRLAKIIETRIPTILNK